MGMDLEGLKPRSNSGRTFRNNVWYWRPIASYIVDNAPSEITSKCKYWQSNDGDGLDDFYSRELGYWLTDQIESGNVQYGDDGPYRLERSNLENFAEFLLNCGGFEIW